MSIVLSLLLACTAGDGDATDSGGSAGDGGDAPVDMRLSEDDLPTLTASQQAWWGPEVTIPPASEKQWCLFGTYEGDDVGIHALTTYQGAFGHHVQIMGTTVPAIDVPDGTLLECTENDALNMADMEPLVIATGASIGGDLVDLPMDLGEGMAVKLDDGQRYVIQVHYVNTSQDEILVKDAAVLDLIPEDEVETWASPFVMNWGDVDIAPGSPASYDYGCTLDEELDLLYILGHMHEWGTALSITHTRDGVAETLYDIPEWDPLFRDDPPVAVYGPDTPMQLLPGDRLELHCEWFNDTEQSLVFPSEMCVAVGVVFEKKTTVFCGD